MQSGQSAASTSQDPNLKALSNQIKNTLKLIEEKNECAAAEYAHTLEKINASTLPDKQKLTFNKVLFEKITKQTSAAEAETWLLAAEEKRPTASHIMLYNLFYQESQAKMVKFIAEKPNIILFILEHSHKNPSAGVYQHCVDAFMLAENQLRNEKTTAAYLNAFAAYSAAFSFLHNYRLARPKENDLLTLAEKVNIAFIESILRVAEKKSGLLKKSPTSLEERKQQLCYRYAAHNLLRTAILAIEEELLPPLVPLNSTKDNDQEIVKLCKFNAELNLRLVDLHHHTTRTEKDEEELKQLKASELALESARLHHEKEYSVAIEKIGDAYLLHEITAYSLMTARTTRAMTDKASSSTLHTLPVTKSALPNAGEDEYKHLTSETKAASTSHKAVIERYELIEATIASTTLPDSIKKSLLEPLAKSKRINPTNTPASLLSDSLILIEKLLDSLCERDKSFFEFFCTATQNEANVFHQTCGLFSFFLETRFAIHNDLLLHDQDSAKSLKNTTPAAKLDKEAYRAFLNRNFKEARDLLAQAERLTPSRLHTFMLYSMLDAQIPALILSMGSDLTDKTTSELSNLITEYLSSGNYERAIAIHCHLLLHLKKGLEGTYGDEIKNRIITDFSSILDHLSKITNKLSESTQDSEEAKKITSYTTENIAMAHLYLVLYAEEKKHLSPAEAAGIIGKLSTQAPTSWSCNTQNAQQLRNPKNENPSSEEKQTLSPCPFDYEGKFSKIKDSTATEKTIPILQEILNHLIPLTKTVPTDQNLIDRNIKMLSDTAALTTRFIRDLFVWQENNLPQISSCCPFKRDGQHSDDKTVQQRLCILLDARCLIYSRLVAHNDTPGLRVTLQANVTFFNAFKSYVNNPSESQTLFEEISIASPPSILDNKQFMDHKFISVQAQTLFAAIYSENPSLFSKKIAHISLAMVDSKLSSLADEYKKHLSEGDYVNALLKCNLSLSIIDDHVFRKNLLPQANKILIAYLDKLLTITRQKQKDFETSLFEYSSYRYIAQIVLKTGISMVDHHLFPALMLTEHHFKYPANPLIKQTCELLRDFHACLIGLHNKQNPTAYDQLELTACEASGHLVIGEQYFAQEYYTKAYDNFKKAKQLLPSKVTGSMEARAIGGMLHIEKKKEDEEKTRAEAAAQLAKQQKEQEKKERKKADKQAKAAEQREQAQKAEEERKAREAELEKQQAELAKKQKEHEEKRRAEKATAKLARQKEHEERQRAQAAAKLAQQQKEQEEKRQAEETAAKLAQQQKEMEEKRRAEELAAQLARQKEAEEKQRAKEAAAQLAQQKEVEEKQRAEEAAAQLAQQQKEYEEKFVTDLAIKLPDEIFEILNLLDGELGGSAATALICDALQIPLTSNKIKDYDIFTSTSPKEIEQFLKAKNYPYHAHEKLLKRGIHSYSITIGNYAIDVTYEPSHVKSADLTAKSLRIKKTGHVYNYFNGLVHLKARLLKSIKQPSESFSEDPIRMLRIIDAATKTGFRIEDEEKQALIECSPLLQKEELSLLNHWMKRLINSEFSRENFQLLLSSGLLGQLFPTLKNGIEQNRFWLKTLLSNSNPLSEQDPLTLIYAAMILSQLLLVQTKPDELEKAFSNAIPLLCAQHLYVTPPKAALDIKKSGILPFLLKNYWAFMQDQEEWFQYRNAQMQQRLSSPSHTSATLFAATRPSSSATTNMSTPSNGSSSSGRPTVSSLFLTGNNLNTSASAKKPTLSAQSLPFNPPPSHS